jgi:hypothetical protein
MNQDSLMKALLGDKNMQEKTRSWRVPGAEPCVFDVFVLAHVSKTPFLHAFREKSAARAAFHWATARPNRARTTAKTQGFVTKTRLHYVWQELENWSFTLPKHSQ